MSTLFSINLVTRHLLKQSLNLKTILAQTRRMAAATGQAGGHQNRLALEKSPYLLQHANNPVDWYPWGSEAFDKAKQEQKPIFLSVGYSTCHWCHVMERESFENEEIGKILNDNFVAIKVDREERPDVDKVYMTFVQLTTGGGGWPMSVWLTPDLRPIIAGTYFPPNDRYYGRPGFKTVLLNIAAQWKAKGAVMEERGTAILDAITAASAVKASAEQEVPGQEAIDKCYSMLTSSYDDRMGGFGKAPKFPQPVNFNFMLRKFAEEPTTDEGKKAKKMVLHTLKMMAKGGMHDHIAQGFHRYSTDGDWHVPHFEKMLYDQGQLAASYVEAYQISKEEEFAATARDILKYVRRDLSDPSGGFYSAEDADSLPTKDATEKKEGAFCVWTEQEVRSLLDQPIEGFPKVTLADLFCHHYGVSPDGNVDPFQDPHDELKGQNVLIVRGSIYDTTLELKIKNMKVGTVLSQLEKARKILYTARKERPSPHLDNKMLTAWNGLMISGFAKAAQALGDQSYTHRALAAVEYVRSNLYIADEQTLLRCGYVGEADLPSQSANPIRGFLDDYAFLIRGLMDAYEASLDERLLEWAERLQQRQDDLFWDPEDGGYFANDTSDPSIVLRMKDDQDGAEPSGNSVAALNLLRLSNFLDKPEWKEKALTLLKTFGERLEKIPLALPEMVTALQFLKATPKQIIIVGEADSEDTKALLKCVHSHFLPNKVLMLADPSKMESGFLASRVKVIPSLKKLDDKATAYVCENYSCSRPVTSVDELKKLLQRKT